MSLLKQQRQAVFRALHGHEGGFRVNAYEGLITEEEIKSLVRKTKSKQGKKLHDEKKGIHSQTHDEKIEVGIKSAISRGEVPWRREGEELPNGSVCELSEIEFAYELSQQPEYQRGSLVKVKKIADVLNEVYHSGEDVRTSDAVRVRLYNYKKELENKLD